ncbi:Alpha crystallin/Hsp20 domain [Trinorchestia longiramus]|nr:Alpha crystallin/Hsp20 domain [Trinorchestia longiramus]
MGPGLILLPKRRQSHFPSYTFSFAHGSRNIESFGEVCASRYKRVDVFLWCNRLSNVLRSSHFKMVPRVSRSIVPAMRSVLRHRLLRPPPYYAGSNGQVRGFSGTPFKSRDPFQQMEAFMRDMDRKLQRTIDSTFGSWRHFPEWRETSVAPRVAQVGEVLDLSTNDTFKLVFNCYGVKPEDINVTLKENILTVTVKAMTESEGCKQIRQTQHEQTLPEGVDAAKLESSLSADGQLSVMAPRDPPEAPQQIKIKRE